jgi:hypothetical protein
MISLIPTQMPSQIAFVDNDDSHRHEDDILEATESLVYTINVVSGIVGACFSLFVVTSYVCFEPLRKRSLELVALLSLSELSTNIAYLLFENDKHNSSETGCFVQGILVQFFSFRCVLGTHFVLMGSCAHLVMMAPPLALNSIIAWALTIGSALYCIVVLRDAFLTRSTCHGLVWSAAALSCLPPLATGSFGDAGPWCWIRADDPTARLMRMVCFYGPCWLMLAAMAVMFKQVVEALIMGFWMNTLRTWCVCA